VSPPDGIVDVFRAACSRLCPARLFTSFQSNRPLSLDGVRPATKPNAPKLDAIGLGAMVIGLPPQKVNRLSLRRQKPR
jgi:hypothetical protein